MNTTDFLTKLTKRQDVNNNEAKKLAGILLDVKTSPVLTASLLTSLASKGETAIEILAFVEFLRKNMIKISYNHLSIDTCGTGGDGQNTFNISTVAALIVASCGVKTAKHGNRSASGVSGSADILEAMGVNINLTEEAIK